MKLTHGCALALVLGVVTLGPVGAQPVKAGAGTYFLSPKGSDRAAPSAPFRTEALMSTAAQTNQWYSTLIFNPKPEALFAHPLTFKTTPAGFEMALASKDVVPTVRRDEEIHYLHRDALVFSPLAFEPVQPV